MDFNITDESPECPIGCELHAECIARDQADDGDDEPTWEPAFPLTISGGR